jgi:hypothetical protein
VGNSVNLLPDLIVNTFIPLLAPKKVHDPVMGIERASAASSNASSA